VRHNIAGIMDGKHRVYGSIREGIEAQAALLQRGYISQGLTTIPQIGRKYSPVGATNDPNNTNWQWPTGVQREYDRIKGATSMRQNTRGLGGAPAAVGVAAPSSVTMAPVININGSAGTGSPESIGRRVGEAMRRPTQVVLDEIKRARSHEERLGYV
jgi:hypothetical protein